MVRLDGLRLTELCRSTEVGGGRRLTRWHAAALSHADSDLEKAWLGPGLNPGVSQDTRGLSARGGQLSSDRDWEMRVGDQCKILKTDRLGLSSTESFSNLPVAAPKLCMKCNQRKLKLFHVQYFVLILSLRTCSNFLMICGPIEVFRPYRFCVTQVTISTILIVTFWHIHRYLRTIDVNIRKDVECLEEIQLFFKKSTWPFYFVFKM